MGISYSGALAATFIAATGISYGFDFVPSHDPLVKLAASCAIAAASTVTAFAAAKLVRNNLFAFIIGAGLGFFGAEHVAGDIVKTHYPDGAPHAQIEQVMPAPALNAPKLNS